MPWLTKRARISLIVPGMSHTLLVSTKVLTYAGCKVIYDKNDCRVYFNEDIVWAGVKKPSTGLWVLPIKPRAHKIKLRRHFDDIRMLHESTNHHMAANAYTMTSK